MRSTGIQGKNNPSGTYLPKDALMVKMAQRRAKRAYKPMPKITATFPMKLRKK